jgi:RNA polymerase sigma-70 factor (ECF subfamily)
MVRRTDEALTSDVVLIGRIAHGDETALAELYDRHGRIVYSLALAMLRAPVDAEEVVADTFLQVWGNAGKFDAARSSVGSWLIVIARARALDRLRTQRRRSQSQERVAAADADGLVLSVGRFGDVPDEAAHSSELRELIRRSLQDLPQPQRLVIELAYFEGLSQSEIAAHLNEPLGTIKTRARAALEKLRAALGPYALSAP